MATRLNKTKFNKSNWGFKKWQKEYPNFMTPDVRNVERVGDYFIELSEGSGMEIGTMLYGVSVLQYKDGTFKNTVTVDDVNKSFHNLEEAKAYFEKLKQKYKSYDEMAKEVPNLGDEVIINTGKHIGTKAKIIGMGIGGNNYKVQMEDGKKAIIFPNDLKKVN